MYSEETTLYRAIIIASIIIGIIILYFIVSVIRQQKKFRSLTHQKMEAEIVAIENERKRIASDLHDELGAVLSAVKLRISSVETISETDANNIRLALSHLDDIIIKIRYIANDLMPSVLFRKGPAIAIAEYIQNFISTTGLQIELIPGDIPHLSQIQQVHIYRILQEIIHNTVKHAKAKNLKIELYTNDLNLVILTCDDGIGFDYKSMKYKNSGIGLYTLQTRTDILGGQMYINSGQEPGTRYHIELPLTNLKEM